MRYRRGRREHKDDRIGLADEFGKTFFPFRAAGDAVAVDDGVKPAPIKRRFQLVGKVEVVAAIGDENAKLVLVGQVRAIRLRWSRRLRLRRVVPASSGTIRAIGVAPTAVRLGDRTRSDGPGLLRKSEVPCHNQLRVGVRQGFPPRLFFVCILSRRRSLPPGQGSFPKRKACRFELTTSILSISRDTAHIAAEFRSASEAASSRAPPILLKIIFLDNRFEEIRSRGMVLVIAGS